MFKSPQDETQPDAAQLTSLLKAEAVNLGFTLAGVCDVRPPDAEPGADYEQFCQWLDAGHAGEMKYLPDRREAYRHPRHVLEGVRSILLLGMDYRTQTPAPPDEGQGRISRYAWGEADYHDVIHKRLKALRKFLVAQAPGCVARGVVDTAPLLERQAARQAGLGWQGKNTLLLNKHRGSLFFLAALLTSAPLQADAPHETAHCGTCRACLDACPTQAFPQPYVLDATRCISYLTIELREQIPAELRAGMGDWVFGCDVCQDVCPWNNKAPFSAEPAFQPRTGSNPVDLIELLTLDEDGFRERYKRTPLWRTRRQGLARNAAIALGNHPTPGALQPLISALSDPAAIVRGAAAWALGRYLQPQSRQALQQRQQVEEDGDVRHEIAVALQMHAGDPAK